MIQLVLITRLKLGQFQETHVSVLRLKTESQLISNIFQFVFLKILLLTLVTRYILRTYICLDSLIQKLIEMYFL